VDFKVLLPQAPAELRHRLQRLINRSLEMAPADEKALPVWRADFFEVENSPFWLNLNLAQQSHFLSFMSKALLKEAISIEHAGIAYANKMALLSQSQEERQYYTTVANEELNHLYLLQPYFQFQVEMEAPEFSKLIVQFVESEPKSDAIILIQLLLEGWGIHHYQALLSGTDNTELKEVFSKIVFDEVRHHGGGIILSQSYGINLSSKLIKNIQSIIDAVRIGPFQVAVLLAELNRLSSAQDIVEMLRSIQAEQTTLAKLKLIKQNLEKILSDSDIKKFNWQPCSLLEMSHIIADSADNSKFQDQSKESLL
jgi:rubrerythrin